MTKLNITSSLVLASPLKNMSSSVGMMTFPTYGKIKVMFQSTNQTSSLAIIVRSFHLSLNFDQQIAVRPGCFLQETDNGVSSKAMKPSRSCGRKSSPSSEVPDVKASFLTSLQCPKKQRETYFTSCDLHHDMSRRIFGHIILYIYMYIYIYRHMYSDTLSDIS